MTAALEARSLVALAAVGLFACAETPAEIEDAAAPDATPRDAGMTGAPCTDDGDCEGACLEDPLGAGLRCFDGCGPEDACPTGSSCVRAGGEGGCVQDAAPRLSEGDDCAGGGRCEAALVCTPDHPDGPRCAVQCAGGAPCPDGQACVPESVEPRACLPARAEVFSCPFTECLRADLLCVEATCVAPCGEPGVECPGGGVCVAREGDGALYCRPAADVGLGGGCASGGDGACAEGLECVGRAPGDPGAVCTLACLEHAACAGACGDCAPDEVACRRPRAQDETVCLPAPFGRGDEAGGPGDGCLDHGDTDCRADLDCVVGVGRRLVCAARCDPGCDAGFVCSERSDDTPHCLEGDDVGGPGTPCPDGAGCDETCLGDGPDDRYCTVSCADGVCPPGFGCREGLCRLGEDGRAPLGDACPAAGPGACDDGVCAVHPQSGASVCSRRCDEAPCPDDFTCETLDAGRLCFAPAD